MKYREFKERIAEVVLEHGREILYSPNMEYEKTQRQHGNTTCFKHSVSVAYLSVWMAKVFRSEVDMKSLVRGALLHDYFLYDWRESDPSHKWHGFTHAKTACKNADRDFGLNDVEKDIILRHMFPLNITPPKYKESAIICCADKLCALLEVASNFMPIALPGKALAAGI